MKRNLPVDDGRQDLPFGFLSEETIILLCKQKHILSKMKYAFPFLFTYKRLLDYDVRDYGKTGIVGRDSHGG